MRLKSLNFSSKYKDKILSGEKYKTTRKWDYHRIHKFIYSHYFFITIDQHPIIKFGEIQNIEYIRFKKISIDGKLQEYPHFKTNKYFPAHKEWVKEYVKGEGYEDIHTLLKDLKEIYGNDLDYRFVVITFKLIDSNTIDDIVKLKYRNRI